MKPTHVLIAVDFSGPSLEALKYGLWIADAFSAALTVVHVLVEPAGADAVREAEQRLTSLLPERMPSKVRIRVPLVDGKIHEELLRVVENSSPDLVMLGTRGHRPLKRFLLGSTTERLMRVIPVPLITVSTAAQQRDEPFSTAPRLKRILHPTDFSEPTAAVFGAALEFAERFGAELEVVHVVAKLETPLGASASTRDQVAAEQRALVRTAEESLERMIASQDLREVSVRPTVLRGRAWQAILDRGAESGSDLIVMGLHGMSFVERTLLGATAERVIRGSPVPVLGIPLR